MQVLVSTCRDNVEGEDPKPTEPTSKFIISLQTPIFVLQCIGVVCARNTTNTVSSNIDRCVHLEEIKRYL